MNLYELSRLLSNPKVKESILDGYKGYSCLAAVRSATDRTKLGIRLSVEYKDRVFPSSVTIDGNEFPIEVEDGYFVHLEWSGALGIKHKLFKND